MWSVTRADPAPPGNSLRFRRPGPHSELHQSNELQNETLRTAGFIQPSLRSKSLAWAVRRHARNGSTSDGTEGWTSSAYTTWPPARCWMPHSSGRANAESTAQMSGRFAIRCEDTGSGSGNDNRLWSRKAGPARREYLRRGVGWNAVGDGGV